MRTVTTFERNYCGLHNTCEICGTIEAERWVEDVNPVTGVERGVLCGECKTLLVLMNDDPVRMQNLANYLD